MPAALTTCPAKAGRIEVLITQAEDDQAFTALRAAEAWCEERGISVGRTCGPGHPVGLLYGSYDIQKWRNLRPSERAELDGQMRGNFRHGPITIDIATQPEAIRHA